VRAKRIERVQRVMIDKAPQTFVRANVTVGVERDHVVAAGFEFLQNLALGVAGVFQQRKHPVSIGGEDHVVEAQVRPFAGEAQGDAQFVARNTANLHSRRDALPVRRRDRCDVSAATPGYCFPSGMIVHRKQPVVVKEANQHLGRKSFHQAWRTRPHRRNHGQEIKLPEIFRVAALVQKIAQREPLCIGARENLRGFAVESPDFCGTDGRAAHALKTLRFCAK
jgi:hypothetical protein